MRSSLLSLLCLLLLPGACGSDPDTPPEYCGGVESGVGDGDDGSDDGTDGGATGDHSGDNGDSSASDSDSSEGGSDAGTDTGAGTGDSGTGSGTDPDGNTGTGGTSDIEEFCTIACDVCFMGNAPWQSQPADQCIPECVADFEDCPPDQIPAILECTGGPDCPEGMMGFATCLAPYTCLLS